MFIQGDEVNVRGSSSSSAPVLRRVPRGTIGTVVARNHDGDWVAVQFGDGKPGWVHRSLVGTERPDAPDQGTISSAPLQQPALPEQENQNLDSLAGGALQVVRENYTLIQAKAFRHAYELRSARVKGRTSYDAFRDNWINNVSIELVESKIITSDGNRAKVFVQLKSRDIERERHVDLTALYEGVITLTQEDGRWRIDDSTIGKVKEIEILQLPRGDRAPESQTPGTKSGFDQSQTGEKEILPSIGPTPAREEGWLGVSGQPGIVFRGSLGSYGVLITRVIPGSPAEAAKLQPNDLILSVNGTRLETPEELTRLIRANPPGTRLSIELLRNQEQVTMEAVTGKAPHP